MPKSMRWWFLERNAGAMIAVFFDEAEEERRWLEPVSSWNVPTTSSVTSRVSFEFRPSVPAPDAVPF